MTQASGLSLRRWGSLPLTQMGGLREGQAKLEIPRCRYWFQKTESESRSRDFSSTTTVQRPGNLKTLTNEAGLGPSLVYAKGASCGFLLQGPRATRSPELGLVLDCPLKGSLLLLPQPFTLLPCHTAILGLRFSLREVLMEGGPISSRVPLNSNNP